MDLLSANRAALLSRRNDAQSLQQKKRAWEALVDNYNAAHPEYPRTKEALLNLFRNMKAAAKKAYSRNRLAKGTTGITVPFEHLSEETRRLHDLMPEEFEKLAYGYDNDTQDDNIYR